MFSGEGNFFSFLKYRYGTYICVCIFLKKIRWKCKDSS
jgi:hypothetical protein